MIEVYRWRQLDRWDAFTIPHLRIAPHLPQKTIGELLSPRHERVDRSEWSFDRLQPITIHFGGDISRRKLAVGTDYTMPLFWAKPGDVVLSKIDLKNGAVGVLPEGWDNAVVTSHFKVYTPDLTQLDPRYFRMLLQTHDFKKWLWANRSGADGRTEVKLDVFEALAIPLPPLARQQELCDAYTDALTRAAQLEQEAEAIEQAAWRDFEAALGVAPPPPLPDRPVFVARFKDVERWSHEGILRSLDRTPTTSGSVSMIPLGQLGKVSYGIQKCPANRPAVHARPYLRVANVQRGVLDLREIKYINVPDDEMPKLRLEVGDVLLCEGNSPDLVGRGAIWRHGQAYFRSKAKRTTNLASINSKEVAGLPVPALSIDQQQDVLDALHAQVQAAQTKRLEATTLRQSAWAAFESALFTASEEPTA
jgi:type I restriction enzyme S subunit